jgi:uncharacterized protein
VTIASRLQGAGLQAWPAVTRDIEVRRAVPVSAPDGTVLLTDLYLARPRRPLPAVLVRTPYGRRQCATIARLFAERGYHAVVQSCRGTFGSGGSLDFGAEAADGRAAADWITAQPWSDGTIGTYGGSYLAFTQYALASTRPPQLKAMAIGVGCAEHRADIYPGGSFDLGGALSWVHVIEHQERLQVPVYRTWRFNRAVARAVAHLPLRDADTVAVGHPAGFYQDALDHDQPGDPYWDATDFRPLLSNLGVPVTMLGGWFDLYMPHLLADYQALRDADQQARLRIGSWQHYGPELFRYQLADALDWFGTHLLGRPPATDPAPLRVHVMGGGGWRGLTTWPPKGARLERWHLQPGAGLGPAVPDADGELDRYTYDPAVPTPSVGGSDVLGGGPRDNRALEARPDVLTYTSAPLAGPLVITGDVAAQLFVGSDRAHTDFFVRLCDVDPAGKSVNISDGLLRLTSATRDPQHITVALSPVAHRFNAGHRVRLQVSSGAHPRYARNPGTGEPLATATKLLPARQAVYHDESRPSAILLPVVPSPDQRTALPG